jgi:multidrug efflux system membrane fusion protein
MTTSLLRRSITIALVLPLAAAGCTKGAAGPQQGIPVTVAKVVKQSIPYEIDGTGTAEPLQTVAIVSQVGGLLTKVAFKEGEDVKEGQLLLQIDPRPYQAALDQAQGILERDKAQLANAELDLTRYEALVQKDYVTTQQYEQAKTAVVAGRATVTSDQANVETARLNLQFAAIRSPISGRAGSLLVKQGNLVKAGGQPLVTINQIQPILVRFVVPVVHLPQLRQYGSGALPVQVHPGSTSGVGNTSTGVLSFVDNAVDTMTGTILLKARFENKDATLWPGEFVSVTLNLFTQADALVIPSSAVVQGQQGAFVFVIKQDQTADPRPITIGRIAGDLTTIDKGLTEGETVVTDGQLRLTAGSHVQVKGESTVGGSAAGTTAKE